MKLWLVAACILCVSLPVALSLKCYDCTSTDSWDDCKTKSESKSCSDGEDRCAKVYLKGGSLKIFRKYCTASSSCAKDGNPTCKAQIGSFECDVNCCTGDNCNAGSAFRVSGILLLACALVSLMMFTKA